jgi:hypothetical protein
MNKWIMNEEFLNKQPKIILEIYISYIKIYCGFRKCKDAFELWQFLMNNDLERLNERCYGLNAFDGFYSYLGGSWGGDR